MKESHDQPVSLQTGELGGRAGRKVVFVLESLKSSDATENIRTVYLSLDGTDAFDPFSCSESSLLHNCSAP